MQNDPRGCTLEMFGKKYRARRVDENRETEIKYKIRNFDLKGDMPRLVFLDDENLTGPKKNMR